MIQSSSREKPEVMSLTWNPRLVNTPTPTISATTIAVAVTQDTVAALPPPDFELAMNNSPRSRAPITAFLSQKLNDCIRFSPPEYPPIGLHNLQNRIRYMNFI
jgi:hypothetical protein